MIDAGAVFKLLGANIDEGSSDVEDRPQRRIASSARHAEGLCLLHFLLRQDDRQGRQPVAGDAERRRLGRAGVPHRPGPRLQRRDPPSRIDLEKQGIFLNYVNHAAFTYGGGKVSVKSVVSVYDPIYMAQTRVTASYNTITNSADAAMSADPNSFLESKFEGNGGGDGIAGINGNPYNGTSIRTITTASAPISMPTTSTATASTASCCGSAPKPGRRWTC